MYSQNWEKAEYDSSLKEVEQRKRWERGSLLSASESCETQGGEVKGHWYSPLNWSCHGSLVPHELTYTWVFGSEAQKETSKE